VLTADISLAGYPGRQFSIIGSVTNPFTGVFDGNDHCIAAFKYSPSGKDCIGVFGCVDGANAEIRDLGITNVLVVYGEGSYYVGTLVGLLQGGTVSNCYVEGGSVYTERRTSGTSAGGLVGRNEGLIANCHAQTMLQSLQESWVLGGLAGSNDGTIINSYSSTSPRGYGEVGGLVGVNSGTISNCFSTGSPDGFCCIGGLVGTNRGIIASCYWSGHVWGELIVGGIVGDNYGGTVRECWSQGVVSLVYIMWPGECYDGGGLVGGNSGSIINSYSACSVEGDNNSGGLVGYNYGSVQFCYSVGSVTGDANTGGLVGYNSDLGDGGNILASFWDRETSGRDNMCGYSDGSGCCDANGLTTIEMQTENTFTDAGWDFVGETVNGPNDIWTIHETVNYPKLVWPLVNLVGWYEVDGLDFAYFASRWGDENCGAANDCDGVDIDFSGAVNGRDLKIFCDHWLDGVSQ